MTMQSSSRLASAAKSWSLALMASLTLSGAPAHAAPESPQIQEWTVPYPNSRPRDPSVGADGRVWFVGQTDNYLGVYDPNKNSFERIGLPEGTRPHSVLVAPSGEPWVAGNGNGTLLRYSVLGQLEQTIEVPKTAGLKVRDPHTLAFDGHGGLWFTMQGGNAIGHLNMTSEKVRLFPIAKADSRPYGLVADREGNAWAVLFAGGDIVHIDRRTMKLSSYPLPRDLARPRRLALDSQDNVWYVDYAQDKLGRFSPTSKKFTEWTIEPQPAAPYAMAIDGRDDVWLFLTAPQPNRVLRFNPEREAFDFKLELPSGGGAVRNAEYHRESDSIWFGSDRNTLGQLRLSVDSAD